MRGDETPDDTPRVQPNHGVVAGDLRVLVIRTGDDLTHTSIGSLLRAAVVGPGWKVVVSRSDSPEVLAERSVGHHHTAVRIREGFVRAVLERRVDGSDAQRVRRLLES